MDIDVSDRLNKCYHGFCELGVDDAAMITAFKFYGTAKDFKRKT